MSVIYNVHTGIARSKMWGGQWTHMVSAECKPITGGLGAEPPVGSRGKGDRVVKPPEADKLLTFGCPLEEANLLHSAYFANSLNSKYL